MNSKNSKRKDRDWTTDLSHSERTLCHWATEPSQCDTEISTYYVTNIYVSKCFLKIEHFVTTSSNISNQRCCFRDYKNTKLLALWRHWLSQWRHKYVKITFFGHNFASNRRRHFKLSVLDNKTQGSSYVTLTLTFDLDLEKLGQGQSFRKKQSNFLQPYWVVY